MDSLLTKAGLKTEFRKFLSGYAVILRYRILKRMGLRQKLLWRQVLPWGLITRAIDKPLKLSDQSIC